MNFSSSRKAWGFCRKLSNAIAADSSDNTYDFDKLKSMEDVKDMKVSQFLQVARKERPADWTTGKKKVLVIVADWKEGDFSKAPFTKQTTTPEHYKSKIF